MELSILNLLLVLLVAWASGRIASRFGYPSVLGELLGGIVLGPPLLGLLHGGASLLMAESAASAHASWKVDFTQKMPVGVEINGSHLASAREGHVRATATVLRRSRAFIFHEVDITHEESGKLLCRARVTNYYKPVG